MPRLRVDIFDTTMSPPTNILPIPREVRIQLAIQALDTGQICGVRHAARNFNIPLSSLQTRRAETTSRRDAKPKSIKLTVTKEEAIKQYILELDSRGLASPLNTI